MFDVSAVSGLDGAAAADALVEVREALARAETAQLVLAAHWADLHAPGFVEECRRDLPGERGVVETEGERSVPAGADGCPEMAEFAAAELAALLGRTPRSGQQLVADAVNLRHRHPLLWQALLEGRVRAWVAARVARRCAAAGLVAEKAGWVDAESASYASTLPPARFLRLVEARILQADPESAAARAELAAMARFVRVGASDEHGLRTLVARAQAGDVVVLVAVLDRLAVLLAEDGDTDPVDVRRATALRLLANPARALAMLTRAELAAARPEPARTPPPPEPCDPDDRGLGWMRDAHGRFLPWGMPANELGESHPHDAALARLLHGSTASSTGGPVLGAQPPLGPGEVESSGDPALLDALAASLEGFDPSLLDPVVSLTVHLSESALASCPHPGPPPARVVGVGPEPVAAFAAWLRRSPGVRVTVRPVLDAATVVPVDRYEVPARMRRLVTGRVPYEVFPFGTREAEGCDLDHVVPHARGGPTAPENLAPLGRSAHRVKTLPGSAGRWWLRQSAPGVFWWRTPHGHWLVVDPAGTRHIGRSDSLDRQWRPALPRE